MVDVTWTSYDTVGAKEDISDVISNISPTKTPFQMSLGSEKVHQRHFQWQEDSLRAVATNAQPEGFDATSITPVATVFRTNETQILSETVKTAGSADATDYYGRAKESAYQLGKSMAQVKRDLEFALVGSAQTKVVGNNSGPLARQFDSYQAQLLNDGTGNLSATNTVIYTGAVATAFTETNLEDVLQQIYTNGAEPNVIMVTPANSRVIADFAKASGRYRTITSDSSAKEQRTILNVVDLYVSPFGEQRVVLNRFLKADHPNTLVYDTSMWKQMNFRPWFRETLAKTGDNLKQMIVGEFSLKHRNFRASGAIVQNTGTTGY